LCRFRKIFAGGQGDGNRRVLSATQGDIDTAIRQKDKESVQVIVEQFLIQACESKAPSRVQVPFREWKRRAEQDRSQPPMSCPTAIPVQTGCSGTTCIFSSCAFQF